MTTVLACGFEYRTTAEFDSGAVNSFSTPGRTGYYAVCDWNHASLMWNLPEDDEYFFQICTHVTSHDGSAYDVMQWRYGSTVLGKLTNTNGILKAYVGTGTLVGTALNQMSLGTWIVIQVRVKIHDSDGAIEVRIGSSLEISYTGADTKPDTNANMNNFLLMHRWQWSGAKYDDIVVNNTAGSRNNSWPNGIPIYVIRPNAAGDYAQWTPSAGANYDCVDETPPSVTDFVRPTATGQKDLYNFPDCPGAISKISFIAGDYFGQAVGSPPITQFKRLVKTGGSEYEGSGRVLANTFKNHQEIIELNPADSQPWEPADINALQLGMTSLT